MQREIGFFSSVSTAAILGVFLLCLRLRPVVPIVAAVIYFGTETANADSPYAALSPGIGSTSDDRVSVIYDVTTGKLGLDVPDHLDLHNAQIASRASLFITENCHLNFEFPEAGLGFGARAFDTCEADHLFKSGSFNDLNYGNVLPAGLGREFVAHDLTANATIWGGPEIEQIDLVYVPELTSALMLLLGSIILCLRRRAILVLTTFAVLCVSTTSEATHGPLTDGGVVGDEQTSLVYDAKTGDLSLDIPPGRDMTSINIDSEQRLFDVDACRSGLFDGSFDNCSRNNIFKATFGGTFKSFQIDAVLPDSLSKEFLLQDLTVHGSMTSDATGNTSIGTVDLIAVPEPSAIRITFAGFVGLVWLASSRLGQYGRLWPVVRQTDFAD